MEQIKVRRVRSAERATERVVVLMPLSEKQAVKRRAKAAGVTVAEFVRSRLGDDLIMDHAEEIEALCDAIIANFPAAIQHAEEVTAKMDKLADKMKNIKAEAEK